MVALEWNMKIMFYVNLSKSILSADKSVDNMVKRPMKGLYKYWLFWGVNFLLVFLFLIGAFWAFGHFILERL